MQVYESRKKVFLENWYNFSSVTLDERVFEASPQAVWRLWEDKLMHCLTRWSTVSAVRVVEKCDKVCFVHLNYVYAFSKRHCGWLISNYFTLGKIRGREGRRVNEIDPIRSSSIKIIWSKFELKFFVTFLRNITQNGVGLVPCPPISHHMVGGTMSSSFLPSTIDTSYGYR